MKIYNNNQNVTIDEEVANLDIRRISQAIPSLQAARAALVQVQQEGNATKGQTGTAVVEKATELIRRIDGLLQSLENTQTVIRRTVQKYQDIDASLADLSKGLGNWRI